MLPSKNLKASARLLCLNHLVIWLQPKALKTCILRRWKGPSTSVKLQLETNVQDIIKLTNVTICPKVGGQGGKIIMGTLEAHVNGFRYKTSGAHPYIDVVYENIKCPFFRAGEHEIPPILHLHLHNQIMLGTEETNDINFQLDSTLVQTDDRNKDLQDFVDKVADLWESEPVVINYFESPEYEFHGFFPTGARAVFALTLFFLVELVETNPIVVKLDEIEIVNLAQLRPNEIDMTVVFKDFSRDVLQINSIPLELLADIKHRLTCSNVKYYQNERKLNWNEEVKKFRDSPEKFIMDGGWESLDLEAGDASKCFYWEEYGGLDEEDW
ncbi:FACT complex subunit SPT16-like isoform X2 [Papaver somniferum]|uniref:FACT complex subunit SPT16-like isoform X2 n=1 Tax=Papaver somniferum TaxID=3469 RepID=UPI000E701814|nr:FACT complex subunit SPT16-like isoform X2 [Papaver somniferum]